jgi:hypothetical protein
MAGIFIGWLIVYVLLIAIFVPVLQYGLFEFYVVYKRKSAEEILALADRTTLRKDIRAFYKRYNDKSEGDLLLRLRQFSYLRAIILLLFSGTIIGMGFFSMIRGILNSASTGEFIITLFWLVLSSYTIYQGIRFYQELKKQDRYS